MPASNSPQPVSVTSNGGSLISGEEIDIFVVIHKE
jgi:hypothetical protein